MKLLILSLSLMILIGIIAYRDRDRIESIRKEPDYDPLVPLMDPTIIYWFSFIIILFMLMISVMDIVNN